MNDRNGRSIGQQAAIPEVQWIEMTSPKLPLNSEADSSGNIKHSG